MLNGSGRLGAKLKVELTSELQLTRITGAGDLAGGAGIRTRERRSRRRRGQTIVNVSPLRVIEHVISLEPNLNAHALSEDEVLEKRHVPIVNSRTVDRIAPEVAKASWCG